MIWLILVSLIIGLLDGFRDAMSFHPQSVADKGFSKSYWTTSGSWKNKYLIDLSGELIPLEKKRWYHIFSTPKYEEKFPLSSTWFVSLTDGYHLVKLFQMLSIAILGGIVVLGTHIIINMLIARILIAVGFTLTYKIIFK